MNDPTTTRRVLAVGLTRRRRENGWIDRERRRGISGRDLLERGLSRMERRRIMDNDY